jgi:hypothetical protein
MPYSVGERGSYGCSGYPVIKDDDKTVMGCHESMTQAQNQISAINMSEAEKRKKRLTSGAGEFVPASEGDSVLSGVGIKNPQAWPGTEIKTDGAMGQPHPASTGTSVFRKPKRRARRSVGGVGGNSSGAVATTGGGTGMGTKSEHDEMNPKPITETGEFQNDVETRNRISREIGKEEHRVEEGDFVMGETTEGLVHGVVEHIMWEGGVYGQPGTDYAIESLPDNPAMAVRLYEQDMNEDWVPTAYSIGMMYNDAVVVDMEDHDMDEEDMEYMSKAETYSPNDGMKAAARTAIKWKEDGKAKGAGTAVGWGRARDIVAGRSMSLSVVKRMYSFFSRHEVDKQGKGFNPGSEGYPSKGRIMWNAWGGDAGFAWSRAIVKRNEDKALFADFGKDHTKTERLSEIFKADSVRVGQMVSWNSSGGRATGKVKRIISSGSYNVPGTEFTINGTEENPAVVITLYRNGKPTDQTVAHRRSSLRAL